MKKVIVDVDFSWLERKLLGQQLEGTAIRTSKLLDIHTITAAITLQIPYSQVTKPQRTRVGKTLNFSMLYTPGAMWEVPTEKTLMAIWTDKERAQLCIDLGVTQTVNLYKALTAHFNTTYKAKA